jgi:hypothetical protein
VEGDRATAPVGKGLAVAMIGTWQSGRTAEGEQYERMSATC